MILVSGSPSWALKSFTNGGFPLKRHVRRRLSVFFIYAWLSLDPLLVCCEFSECLLGSPFNSLTFPGKCAGDYDVLTALNRVV